MSDDQRDKKKKKEKKATQVRTGGGTALFHTNMYLTMGSGREFVIQHRLEKGPKKKVIKKH
jgi:hypothetical protein